MGVAYACERVFAGLKDFPRIPGKTRKEQMDWLLDGRMTGQYLGYCLDGIRWANMVTCYWEMDARDMVNFVLNWMEQNPNFTELWHETPRDEFWKFMELPYIKNDGCPRNSKHVGELVEDRQGRIRCAHEDPGRPMKPGFVRRDPGFDEHSQMQRVHFREEKPEEPDTDDKNAWHLYRQASLAYSNEENSFIPREVCYAIIAEPREWLMPLETVFARFNIAPKTRLNYCCGAQMSGERECKRLDELEGWERQSAEDFGCRGHYDRVRELYMHKDGWELAHFVQTWYEQLPGDAMPPLYDSRPDPHLFDMFGRPIKVSKREEGLH